jgi:hypothetical protein
MSKLNATKIGIWDFDVPTQIEKLVGDHHRARVADLIEHLELGVGYWKVVALIQTNPRLMFQDKYGEEWVITKRGWFREVALQQPLKQFYPSNRRIVVDRYFTM